MARFWHEIELAAVEENPKPVIFEASESSCSGFDGLDPVVKSLCSSVCYAVTKVA